MNCPTVTVEERKYWNRIKDRPVTIDPLKTKTRWIGPKVQRDSATNYMEVEEFKVSEYLKDMDKDTR